MERKSKLSWWSHRTSFQKSLLFTVSLLITIILFSTFCVLAGNHSNVDSSTSHRRFISRGKRSSRENVCTTDVCYEEASRIKKYMDTSSDPCVDFFQYACGGYLKNTDIPSDHMAVSQFQAIDDKLKEQLKVLVEEKLNGDAPVVYRMVQDLYKSCMDTEQIDKLDLQKVKTLLENLGGWPIVAGDNWNAAGFDVFKSASQFQAVGLKALYLFRFYVDTDLSNSSQRTIIIDEPRLGMPSREYLLRGFDDTKVQAYYKYMVSMAKLLGADSTRASDEAKKVVLFEIEIAKVTTPAADRRDDQKNNNVMSIAQLKQKFPDIPWSTYIQGLMPITIEDSENILVISPNYIGNISTILRNTPRRDIANYVMWTAVHRLVNFLPDYVRDIKLEYLKVMAGIEKRPPRWKECVSVVTDTLPVLIGSMYVKNYFDRTAKQRAEQMVTYLRSEFENILRNIDWMDSKTKKRAFEKAKAIAPYIGYPEELLDHKKIYKTVDGLKISPDEYLENNLRMSIYSTNKKYNKLREPVDKTDWETHAIPAMVNAFYNPAENSIQFPAAILQGVFFNKDRPNYMNFGGIGFVIGHEITHGFDDSGRQYDKNGDLNSWWEPETEKTFIKKAKCIIEQYSNFTIEEVGMNINGKLTAGENIADNGGVKEGYNAYLQWVKENGEEATLPGVNLNQRQLLLLNGAQIWCGKRRPEMTEGLLLKDPHSPQVARTNIPYQNLASFSKDFNCDPGTPMNPIHKCAVW